MITAGWTRFGEYSHFLKGNKNTICLKREFMYRVILLAMTYEAETWTRTQLHQRNLSPQKCGNIGPRHHKKRYHP